MPFMVPAAAFALGAIVAPPDAVAATAIFRRLGVPRRVVTILEGESLVNDATAITLYRLAVLVALGGEFSAAEAGVEFLRILLGGVLVGLLVGFIVTEAWRRTNDPTLEIMVSLLAPFAAYLPAEALGVSGVLATVVTGLIAGRQAPRAASPQARLSGQSVWSIVTFTINGFAFMLIGLQLPSIVDGLSAYPTADLVTWAAVISLVVVVARIVWVFPATYVPRLLSAKVRARDPSPPPSSVFVVSWAGMRGAVSLAAALALPLAPKLFPDRDLVIFLTFCVIFVTLVGQGLTLPWIVRRLGVMEGTGRETEEAQARLAATDAALRRLEDLELEYPTHKPLIDQLRSRYEHEAGHSALGDGGPRDAEELELLEHLEIRNAVLDAQREAVITLRDDGVIGDEALAVIQRDLDLEAVRSGA
jgi:CPA1 family monovalent cation:H+ antiporter